ncbi:MAG: three-Cys-motif partner protein TcmP [Magnetococcales bacterium]|nr:three-Cys-motif partner protein TcmP [Magnetococcales bacterium]
MPAKGGYKWDFDSPPEIEPHTLVKHELLKDYLIQYFRAITVQPQIESVRIVLVDAFAGGGVYTRWDDKRRYEGSPLIMMRAVRQAEEEINKSRKKPLKIKPKFYFIEESDEGFRCLSRMLRESDIPYQGDISLRQGDFQQIYMSLIHEIAQLKTSKVLFILDQYGYKNVPMTVIYNIFSAFPSPEVILTFAVDSLIDYLSPNNQRAVENIGLSKHIPSGDELRTLKTARDYRQIIQKKIIQGIYQESGASFYTPFLIGSTSSSRAYWLCHLAKHYRARDVMMEHHWNNPGRFSHYGSPGMHMFSYDPKNDPLVTGQLAFEFDGAAQEVSLAQLADDLPRHIYDDVGQNGIIFSELLGKKFNDTPATIAMIRDSFELSLRDQDIQIIGKNGEMRRKAKAMKLDDIILPHPQLRLKF